MKYQSSLVALAAGLSLTTIGLAPAAGQDMPGGTTMTFGLDSTVRANDNLNLVDPKPGISTLWDNRLTFGYLNETQLSTLTFDLGTTLRVAKLPSASAMTDLDDITAAAGYTLEGANANVTAGVFYNQIDMSFAEPLDFIDLDTGTTLLANDGTQTNFGGNIGFETGINDPIGFGGEVSYVDRTYLNATNPALFDFTNLSAEAFTRLRLSPTAEGRITAFYQDFDTENATQTRTQTLGVTGSVAYDINPITTMNASLGYVDVTQTTNAPATNTQAGLVGGLTLTRAMPRGSVNVSYNRAITISGPRDNLTVGGTLDMPNGSVTASAGATRGPTGIYNPIGSVDYVYDLPRGAITASFAQSFGTTDAGVNTGTTTAGLGLETDINPSSSLIFTLDYAEVTNLDASTVESVGTFVAAYNRDLTPDWGLTAGYEFTVAGQTGAAMRNSNELFFTLSRDFTIRR